jgi:hypothetical protein
MQMLFWVFEKIRSSCAANPSDEDLLGFLPVGVVAAEN